MSDKLTQPSADNAAALPLLPANLTKPQRQSLSVQPLSPTTAHDITPNVDMLLTLLPDDLQATIPPAVNVRHDCREWLTVQPSIVKTDNMPAVDYGNPPDGLTAVERVLWPSVGRACARGVLFLHKWLDLRRYRDACAYAGCDTTLIGILRNASPVYHHLFERVEGIVRADRHAQAEDTLHALANGELRKVKTITDPSGDVTTTDEGAIYDTKALALQLAAGDRNRYGQGATGSAAPVIQLNISIPRPDAIDIAPAVSVSPAEPTDIDYIEP